MLTSGQTANTRNELRENCKRLGEAEESVLKDLRISADEFHAVLGMGHPNSSNVRMVRDYLEDKLKERGAPTMPFSRLADHGANRWFPYDTPRRRR